MVPVISVSTQTVQCLPRYGFEIQINSVEEVVIIRMVN